MINPDAQKHTRPVAFLGNNPVPFKYRFFHPLPLETHPSGSKSIIWQGGIGRRDDILAETTGSLGQ
jgi:hypothetical protein